MKDYIKQLDKDGFAVIQNLFSEKEINQFIRAYNLVSKKKKPEISLEKGRFDIELSGGVFSRKDPKILRDIIDNQLKSDYIRYMGGLPALPNSKDGKWHRDTYTLWRDTLDITLPPYYFTILIPLQDLTKENGATELLVGSHKKLDCYLTNAKYLKTPELATIKKGSAVILDGRLFHRGKKNTTHQTRDMLYIVYCKQWYNDY